MVLPVFHYTVIQNANVISELIIIICLKAIVIGSTNTRDAFTFIFAK